MIQWKPLAHLTVRDPAKSVTEKLCRRAHRGLGVVEVHTAHEEGALRLSHALRVSACRTGTLALLHGQHPSARAGDAG